MTQNSLPWNGTIVGDAGPYSDGDWQTLWRNTLGWGGLRSNVGIFLGSGSPPNEGLRVQAQNPTTTSVDVLQGAALVRGIFYVSDATESFVVAANSSGNPRIDTVVLQVDYSLQTVRLTLKQGTAAATPVPPALTQNVGVLWEIPVADIAAADSFTSISQANITPRHDWVNAPPGVYLDNILNNSGVTLEDGDVVVWDNTADRAITTTTTLDNKQGAGIWRGRTNNGNYGRVQTKGIGYVRANAAVSIGNLLTTSVTAHQAAVNAGPANKVLARAIETSSGAGLVLCNIDVHMVHDLDHILIRDEKASGVAPASIVLSAWRTRELNTEVYDTGGFASLPGSNRILLQPGTYEFWANAPLANIAVGNAIRLFNFTDTAVIQEGSHGIDSSAMLAGRFVLTAAKSIELQQWTGGTANGGIALSTGANEIYASIYLRRHGETP